MSAWQFFMLVSFMYGARTCNERGALRMQVVTVSLATVLAILEAVQ